MPAHGVTVDRTTGGIRPVETLDGAAIGIMASASELVEGDLRLLRTAADLAAVDDGTGSVTELMNVIRKHSNAPVVLNVVDDDNIDIATGNAATFTYAYRFLQAETELGVRPRLLAQGLVGLDGGVRSDLIAVAGRLFATAFLDGPNTTDAEAIADVESYDSNRAAYCEPAVLGEDGKTVGASVYYAAIASTLNFWEAASNKPLLGVESLSRPIGFTMGDEECQAQLLNDAMINTIVRKQGWRLWGGLAVSADPMFKFLNVGRTDDVIAESIQEAFLWAVDKGITKTFVEDVVGSVQGFLRDLRARGAIINGDAWADTELNTPTSLAAGNLYINYEFTPVYPAHSIIMKRHITNKYLSEVFG